jgi:hypothetical protein
VLTDQQIARLERLSCSPRGTAHKRLLESARVGESGSKANSSVGDFVAAKVSKNSRVQWVSSTRHSPAGRPKLTAKEHQGIWWRSSLGPPWVYAIVGCSYLSRIGPLPRSGLLRSLRLLLTFTPHRAIYQDKFPGADRSASAVVVGSVRYSTSEPWPKETEYLPKPLLLLRFSDTR